MAVSRDGFAMPLTIYRDLFILHKLFPNGGKVWRMTGLNTSGSDYDDILIVANCLAEEGHEVTILRAVHYKDPLYSDVYGELTGTKYYRKCPDLIVDGDYVEYESYLTRQPKKAFRNMLRNGLAQSDRIIIRQCNLTDGYMIQQIRGQIQNGVSISSVWIFDGKKDRLLYNTEG